MNKTTCNLAFGIILSVFAGSAFSHGESMRGGGGGSINAVGATILEQKVIGFRWDARRYDTFTDGQMVQFKRDGEDVHMHSSEDGLFLSFGFPVSDDMDISIVPQYNNFRGFKDNGDESANACFDKAASDNGGSLEGIPDGDLVKCISPTDSSPGLGDTLVTGRYRFYSSDNHQVATIFGVIIPTGTVTNKTDNGDIIGTHNQPGSGAITFQAGFGYSGHLSDSLGITADWIVRTSTEGAKNFRTGRSMQADIALSYSIGDFVPVIELNYIGFLQDIENDEIKKNSGGQSIAISPGLSYGVTKTIGIFANYSFVFNDLGGISNDELYRFSSGISYAFD